MYNIILTYKIYKHITDIYRETKVMFQMNYAIFTRPDVLIAVNILIMISWVATQRCHITGIEHLGGTYHLHLRVFNIIVRTLQSTYYNTFNASTLII